MKKEIRVGIIDDDETKVTQIISAIKDGVEKASENIKQQYREYELMPIEVNLQPDINKTLDIISENQVDVLIIDYQLSSYALNVDYTGVGIADMVDAKYLGFPTFVLTSFESELYRQEVFDAYKVFDFERYMSDEKEQIELNKKIIEQYRKRKLEIENKKKELNRLLQLEGTSQKIDDKILELDDFLERSIDGEHAIPIVTKRRLLDSRFDETIDLLKRVVKEMQE